MNDIITPFKTLLVNYTCIILYNNVRGKINVEMNAKSRFEPHSINIKQNL